jgi:hypothetical protein
MTTETATRPTARTTTPTTTATPATSAREPGTGLLKKLYATRPALADRDPRR